VASRIYRRGIFNARRKLTGQLEISAQALRTHRLKGLGCVSVATTEQHQRGEVLLKRSLTAVTCLARWHLGRVATVALKQKLSAQHMVAILAVLRNGAVDASLAFESVFHPATRYQHWT
jgi:hypothetical protein